MSKISDKITIGGAVAPPAPPLSTPLLARILHRALSRTLPEEVVSDIVAGRCASTSRQLTLFEQVTIVCQQIEVGGRLRQNFALE